MIIIIIMLSLSLTDTGPWPLPTIVHIYQTLVNKKFLTDPHDSMIII